MTRHAIVARPIRWQHHTLFPAGAMVELLDTDRAGAWLILGRDVQGVDRATWVRPAHVVPDPSPHLTMRDA